VRFLFGVFVQERKTRVRFGWEEGRDEAAGAEVDGFC
jgi:hypothetical protein